MLDASQASDSSCKISKFITNNFVDFEPNLRTFTLANKKSPDQQQSEQITIAKRFWSEQLGSTQNQSPIESNIENISANINRMDSERLLAIVTQHKLHQQFYSSDDSNDESMLSSEHN